MFLVVLWGSIYFIIDGFRVSIVCGIKKVIKFLKKEYGF